MPGMDKESRCRTVRHRCRPRLVLATLLLGMAGVRAAETGAAPDERPLDLSLPRGAASAATTAWSPGPRREERPAKAPTRTWGIGYEARMSGRAGAPQAAAPRGAGPRSKR